MADGVAQGHCKNYRLSLPMSTYSTTRIAQLHQYYHTSGFASNFVCLGVAPSLGRMLGSYLGKKKYFTISLLQSVM